MPRPKKALISREDAIEKALEIIEEKGLVSFTLSKLAEKMDVRAPSLYHHFRDRSDLLTGVAKRIMTEVKDPRRIRQQDWKEALVISAISARRAILRYPNAAPLLLIYSPRHIMLNVYEGSIRFLKRAGIPEEALLLIVHGLDNLMLGSALTTAYRAQGQAFFPAMNPVEFPGLTMAIKANELNEEELFEMAARTLLKAIEADYDLASDTTNLSLLS